MNWEQKLQALSALGDCELIMRKPGDWFVHQAHTDLKTRGEGILRGEYGNGSTPEEAIEDHWRRLVTDLPDDSYIVVRAYLDDRRAVRWNGFMWVDVREAA